MRTFATKQPTNQDATHQKPVRANPAPVVRSLSTGLTGSAILQRKPGCACGGGCPRCQESSLQTKLKIGEPGDRYEQEADRVAEQVMRMPDSAALFVQRMAGDDKQDDIQTESLATSITPLLQREAMLEEEEKEKEEEGLILTKPALQGAKNNNSLETGHDLESRLNNSGSGSPLPNDVRSFMEPRFGADFSRVRVHTGIEAVQMNQELNAQAFTHKQNIYFTEGKSPAKDTLTAHELTHVVQQDGSTVQPKSITQVAKKANKIQPNSSFLTTFAREAAIPETSVQVTHSGWSMLQLQQAASRSNVTSIDAITSPSQSALTNFPAIPGDPDCTLNAPGPLNNTTTGSIRNNHQIHFHLAGIKSGDVSLLRIVERTTVVGGKKETIEKSDGPSNSLVARPSDSLIAVADCPGAKVLSPNPAAFPISYHAHFILLASDSVLNNAALAKISYDVTIDKQAIDDPSPTNTFNVTDKQMF